VFSVDSEEWVCGDKQCSSTFTGTMPRARRCSCCARLPDEETAILQPERAGDLLERLHGHPLYLLASLLLATGLRRGEALALRWRDGFVLAGSDCKPQSPDMISTAWGRAMDRIGMPEITLHSLRHTHASMLIAAGVDILTISRRLGHANPTTTLNTYGHLVHGTDDRAAEVMDQAFGEMVAKG